jgi:N6-L-threonylcarbamoyladenine synthase
VGANLHLRQTLKAMTKRESAEVFYPRIEFCTDNGAMIAYVGCLRLMAGRREPLVIKARARWSLEQLESVSTSA